MTLTFTFLIINSEIIIVNVNGEEMTEQEQKTEKKNVTVNRKNPLVRVPAILFHDIDGRKDRVQLLVTFSPDKVIIEIDKEKLEGEK